MDRVFGKGSPRKGTTVDTKMLLISHKFLVFSENSTHNFKGCITFVCQNYTFTCKSYTCDKRMLVFQR